MSERNSKTELKVLIRNKTRYCLSYLYITQFQEKYPSFSVFIEALLLKGMEGL